MFVYMKFQHNNIVLFKRFNNKELENCDFNIFRNTEKIKN